LSGDKNTDKIDNNQGSDDDEDLIEEFGREEFENEDDENDEDDEDDEDDEENAEIMKT
jgi:hypothetical protein